MSKFRAAHPPVERRQALIVPGASLILSPGQLWIRSERTLETLSSASIGGGYGACREIIILHVDKNYNCDSPEADLESLARTLGIGGAFVGLMTAAYVELAGVSEGQDESLRVCAIVTAGVSNATAAGRETPWRAAAQRSESIRSVGATEATESKDSVSREIGTINTIVLLDANLAPEAAVNLVMTVTESKTLTLIERGIKTRMGLLASGTSTDTVTIGWTGQGESVRYAGPSTPIGQLAASLVRQALDFSLGANPLLQHPPLQTERLIE